MVPLRVLERGVHRAGGSIAHVGQDVAVDVEGEAYVGMPEEVLDELGVDALAQQEGGARVPEVVEAGPCGQAGALQGGLERAGEVTTGERRPDRGTEDEAVVLPELDVPHPLLQLSPAMLLERRDSPPGEPHLPALAALRGLEDVPAFWLGERAAYL